MKMTRPHMCELLPLPFSLLHHIFNLSKARKLLASLPSKLSSQRRRSEPPPGGLRAGGAAAAAPELGLGECRGERSSSTPTLGEGRVRRLSIAPGALARDRVCGRLSQDSATLCLAFWMVSRVVAISCRNTLLRLWSCGVANLSRVGLRWSHKTHVHGWQQPGQGRWARRCRLQGIPCWRRWKCPLEGLALSLPLVAVLATLVAHRGRSSTVVQDHFAVFFFPVHDARRAPAAPALC